MNTDEYWMRRAFELAQIAQSHDEVPVGAVIVYKDNIIGEGWNRPLSLNDPCAHAEIIAIRNAARSVNNYRLLDSIMYVTLEPCAMCAGALIHARLSKLVYAVDDPKTGACGSVFNLLQTAKLNHQLTIEKGLLEQECRTLIQAFFKAKRENK